MTSDYQTDVNYNPPAEFINEEDFELNLDALKNKLQVDTSKKLMTEPELIQIIGPLSSETSKDLKPGKEDMTYENDKTMSEYDPSICNLKIDQTTSKEYKEGNVNYLNYRLVNEMYEMLMFSGDLRFAIEAAEMLYSRTKIDDEDFVSPYAAYYYANRRNMIEIDLLESFYKTYLNLQNETFGMVRIFGNISKIGYKFKQQVVMFTPRIMDTPNWDTYIIRRGTNVSREIHNIRDNSRINEKEYILMMTLEDDLHIKADSDINDILASESGNGPSSLTQLHSKDITLTRIKNSHFIQKLIPKGKRISRMVIGFIIDIAKDYSIKLYTLPDNDDSEAFNLPELQWMMLRIPIGGHHQASFQALEEYTTKSNCNPVISHLFFTPPLISKYYLENLCNTKANFEMHQGLRIKNQIRSMMLNLSEKLDASQVSAVEFALTHTVSLIHAPFCTGKLGTLVQIVSSWLMISNTNILVCSESNVKADLLHLALLNSGIKSVRVCNSPTEVENTRLCYGLSDTVSKMQEANTHFNAFYVRYPILKKIINEAAVICTTLDAVVSEYFSNSQFPRVIVDDASSSCEALLLAAVTKNCQHLVLFGDHKAMPPRVQSELSACKGMRISLFERYVFSDCQACQARLPYVLLGHAVSHKSLHSVLPVLQVLWGQTQVRYRSPAMPAS
jgi:hypothetical protein